MRNVPGMFPECSQKFPRNFRDDYSQKLIIRFLYITHSNFNMAVPLPLSLCKTSNVSLRKNTHRQHNIVPAYKRNPIIRTYDKCFHNQKVFGKRIADAFLSNSSLVNQLAIAPTQSGKTGSMACLIYEIFQNKLLRVPKEHVFIFTGHSSTEWITQTKERFPSWMHSQIFHRNQALLLSQILKSKKNVLLIIDECHIASKFNQTLYKLFNTICNNQVDALYSLNYKIVQFTATPESLHEHFSRIWGNAHSISFMDVPKQYISVERLISQNRVFQAKDLCCLNDPISLSVDFHLAISHIIEIKNHIDNMPHSYHIIRTPRAALHNIVIQNFKRAFPSHFTFISTNDISNEQFDNILRVKPNNHTFLFIKDKLRCAKTIHHQFIGVLYERVSSKINKSSIIQGLLGRATGFHSNSHAVVFSYFI